MIKIELSLIRIEYTENGRPRSVLIRGLTAREVVKMPNVVYEEVPGGYRYVVEFETYADALDFKLMMII